jgi:hypothetical protein
MTMVQAVLATWLAVMWSSVGTTAWLQPNATLQPASAEIETLVREVLESQLMAKFPDFHLLDRSRPIAIRADVPMTGLLLSDAALPRIEKHEFRLVSLAEAQAEADRVQQPFRFIEVERVAITGDMGTLTMGVELTLPSNSNFVKMCCCNAAVVFRRLNDRWTFVSLDLVRCR